MNGWGYQPVSCRVYGQNINPNRGGSFLRYHGGSILGCHYHQVSHYFKRRKMFPTQEVKEERPDGSLVVSYRVGHYEAIRNILKSWIPNIVILEPEGFKKELLKDVKGWVRKQEQRR